MRLAPRVFLAFSTLVFIITAGISVRHGFTQHSDGLINCSAKAIMRFEDMDKENVNGHIHFNFGAQGQGSMVVEGYTHSAAGRLYLQRYVKFTWSSQRTSSGERHYHIGKWEARASSIDESPDVIFDYFMREMSDSHDGLFLSARTLNDHAILFSSINSPLYVCTLKPGSKPG